MKRRVSNRTIVAGNVFLHLVVKSMTNTILLFFDEVGGCPVARTSCREYFTATHASTGLNDDADDDGELLSEVSYAKLFFPYLAIAPGATATINNKSRNGNNIKNATTIFFIYCYS